MDRFVTRTPTWQTLNYSSVVAQSLAEKKKVLTKRTSTQAKDNSRKKPLQQKQLSELSQAYDVDKRLNNLFDYNQVVDAENINGNSNDSGLSSASSISPRYLEDFTVRQDVINNTRRKSVLQTPTKNHLGKLADYIDCPVEKENDTSITITRTPISQEKAEESGQNPEKVNDAAENMPADTDKQLKSQSKTIMARIRKDLNSPSASARLKAIKALRSPTKSAYSYFDVPEAEQSLHLPEPPSIEEIMRNIVVYVEVRSGEDNRSAGVRKVIEALGARVNLSLLRDTTHVIFKDGLMSTFKKAKKLGIPIVSILWIEACKNECRICDPKDYPISNLDRYENPELYAKMKRIKAMQPDSECNKRIRANNKAGGGTPKDSTPSQKATGALKKTSTLVGGTPTSSKNKKKTDISQYFKKLENSTPRSFAQVGGGDGSNGSTPKSPATQLLNRINSECYTPLALFKKVTANNASAADLHYDHNNYTDNDSEEIQAKIANSPRTEKYVKKVLHFVQDDTTNSAIAENLETNNGTNLDEETTEQSIIETRSGLLVTPSPMKKRRSLRRHCLMPVSEIETATDFMKAMAISITPGRATRRRSSLHPYKDMTVENSNNLNNINQPNENILKSVGKRRTLYTAATMDQSSGVEMETDNEIGDKPAHTKSTRRRTIYASQTMETSETNVDSKSNDGFNITTRRRTCYSVKAIEQTTEITQSPSTPRTSARKTLNPIKRKQFIEEDLNTTLSTAKTDKSSSRRKTLLPKATDKPNDANADFFQVNDTDKTVASTVTSINFDEEHIASSTLRLEDIGNKTKFSHTPPASATTGKLLEESKNCAAPLIFSSTRLPGNRRRTLFDVSMDIITQRLQCINQSARRSLAPPTPLNELDNTTESVANAGAYTINSPSLSTTSSSSSLTTSSNSTLVRVNTNNETLSDVTAKDNEVDDAVAPGVTPKAHEIKRKRKLFIPNEALLTSSPASVRSHETTDAAAAVVIVKDKEADPLVVTPKSIDVKRKRKLFMPNELLLTPAPVLATPASINSSNKKLTSELDCLTAPKINASAKSATNKRRTLMPISQPQPTIVTQKSATKNFNSSLGVRARRSTLDFEEIKNTETLSSSAADKESLKIQQTAVKAKKSPVLVYTNMHHQQIDVIHEAICQLGFFTLETTVTDTTTHLVSLEPRRTLNLLRALARGLWILEFSWISDSLNANKWLPEETYELKHFSRAIEINRSEHQAFGNNFKCELFRKIGDFYIASQCYPITKENMRELIVLCGGRVVNNRQKARYIIGDSNQNLPDKLYLTPYWVLDSITKMQLMKINKYVHQQANDKQQICVSSSQ